MDPNDIAGPLRQALYAAHEAYDKLMSGEASALREHLDDADMQASKLMQAIQWIDRLENDIRRAHMSLLDAARRA